MKHNVLAIAALALAAALTACNSGSKNQTPDGWVIKNEIKGAETIETIDLEQIAEAIEVIPIKSDEPIDGISSISGSSNDFIASNNRGETFYHIKDGNLIGKLNAVGRGPNEYNQLYYYSYLPADSLFYGYDSKGQIMCFKTQPFKFESKCPVNIHPSNIQTVGRDQVLLMSLPPIEECKYVEYQELANGAKRRIIKDSSIVYRFDGQAPTKLFRVAKYSGLVFTRSGNDVLVSLLMPQHTLYRYADGKIEKILTVDYGNMEKPEPKEKIENQGDRVMIRTIINGDYSEGCFHPQLYGSTLAYWHRTVLDDKVHYCFAIATPEDVQNYEPRISGLNFYFNPYDITVDNGIYTMIIQGDWESKINADEELSETGKRIIEAMKNNNDNPIYLQFRLKDKYLNK